MGRTLVAQRSPRAKVATTKCTIHWKIVNFYCSYGRKSYPWYILKKKHIRSWVNLIVDSTSNCRWLVSLRFLRSSDLPFRHGRTSRLPTSNQQRLGVLDVSSVLGGCIWKWRWRPYRKTEYMQFRSAVEYGVSFLNHWFCQLLYYMLTIYNLQISFVTAAINQWRMSIHWAMYKKVRKKRNPHSHGVFQLQMCKFCQKIL